MCVSKRGEREEGERNEGEKERERENGTRERERVKKCFTMRQAVENRKGLLASIFQVT